MWLDKVDTIESIDVNDDDDDDDDVDKDEVAKDSLESEFLNTEPEGDSRSESKGDRSESNKLGETLGEEENAPIVGSSTVVFVWLWCI